MPITHHSFDTPTPGRLECTIPAADVHISTHADPSTAVTIEGAEDQLDAITVRQSGDRIRIEHTGSFERPGLLAVMTQNLFGAGQSTLSVTVAAPAGVSLDLTWASAGVRLDGAFGALKLKSASGDVELRGTATGPVEVRTVSGDVRLDDVAGDVSVQSVSANLHARRMDGELSAHSISGDVRVDAIHAGRVSVQSVSGDVALGIAPGTGIDVDANSTSGRLHSDVELSDDPDRAGGPDAVIRVRTVSGAVRVFRAPQATPVSVV